MVLFGAIFWILCLAIHLHFGRVCGLFIVKYLNCSIEDPNVAEIQTCKLRMLDRTRAAANVVGFPKVDVHSAIVSASLKKKANGWHPFLYKAKFDLCEYFKHPKRFILADAAMYYFTNYTNLNHTCPYKVCGLFTLKYLNCSVEDPNVAEIQTCKLRMLDRTRVAANVVGFPKIDLHSAVVLVSLKKKANGWHPFLYKAKCDLCEYFKHPKRFILADLAMYYLKNYTNVNHKCPYKRGERLFLTDFLVDEQKILSRFPIDTGTYGAFLEAYTLGKLVIKAVIVAEYSDYKVK